MYDADYFERGVEAGVSLYSNYRWQPELTIPMAHEIMRITGISDGDRVLDYGCAKGYLVRALRLLHVKAWGYDISEYAVSECPKEVKGYIQTIGSDIGIPDQYHLVIAKDVLEHLDDDMLDDQLQWLAGLTMNIFVMVPLGDGEKYIIPSYELDKTHVQRRTLEWWKKKLEQFGFDVEARYQWGHLKENWTAVNLQGNGFLLGKR